MENVHEKYSQYEHRPLTFWDRILSNLFPVKPYQNLHIVRELIFNENESEFDQQKKTDVCLPDKSSSIWTGRIAQDFRCTIFGHFFS